MVSCPFLLTPVWCCGLLLSALSSSSLFTTLHGARRTAFFHFFFLLGRHSSPQRVKKATRGAIGCSWRKMPLFSCLLEWLLFVSANFWGHLFAFATFFVPGACPPPLCEGWGDRAAAGRKKNSREETFAKKNIWNITICCHLTDLQKSTTINTTSLRQFLIFMRKRKQQCNDTTTITTHHITTTGAHTAHQ